jgi:hypothetical protein
MPVSVIAEAMTCAGALKTTTPDRGRDRSGGEEKGFFCLLDSWAVSAGWERWFGR